MFTSYTSSIGQAAVGGRRGRSLSGDVRLIGHPQPGAVTVPSGDLRSRSPRKRVEVRARLPELASSPPAATPDFSITVSAVPLLIAATVGSGVCVLGALAARRTAARRWDYVEQQGMRPKNGPV